MVFHDFPQTGNMGIDTLKNQQRPQICQAETYALNLLNIHYFQKQLFHLHFQRIAIVVDDALQGIGV